MNEAAVAVLWRRVHGGDEGAWRELEEAMRGVLHRQAFKVTIPGMELSDRVQEARIGLWLACVREDPGRAERAVAWLSRRVRYHLLDRLKEQCVQREGKWVLNPAKAPVGFEEWMAGGEPSRSDVEREAVERATVAGLIREAGSRYKRGEEILRRLVAMQGRDDRGLKGVASDMGATEAALWQRMTRMRVAMIAAMIRRLAEEGQSPEEWMVAVAAHQEEVLERMNARRRVSYARSEERGARSEGARAR